jgi:hypothetical protein
MMADLAAADAAGDTELAQHIAGRIKAARISQQPQQPGPLRRALNWATTPLHPEIGAQNRAIADKAGPPLINRMLGVDVKNEPDWLAGAKAFVGGMPGADQGVLPTEDAGRMGRFRQEHPILNIALPMAGGMMGPGMLPSQGAAPRAMAAAAPAVTGTVEQAAPAMARAVGAPTNAYEAAARGTKVSELVKAIDANAAAHLGVDTASPQFAEVIGSMPEKWWEGMAQVAKTTKPSSTTVGEVAAFFRDRAQQAGKAAESVAPAAESAAVSSVAPVAEEAAAQAPNFLARAADKLSNMPQQPISLLDLLMASHGYAHGGPLKAAAMAIGSRAARNYGPQAAGWALRKASQVPTGVGTVTAANALKGALENQ